MGEMKDGRSINRTARLAGLLYVLSIPVSVFGYIYVPSQLVVEGDAATTAANITASAGLFRSGIVAWLLGQTIFVILPLVLYKLFKNVSKTAAVFMVAFIVLAVPMAFVNELNRLAVLVLLGGAPYLQAFEPGQLQAMAMFFLGMHEQGINVASLFWGLWLLPFGYLVFKSGFLPRFLGILLMIGCLGYVADFLIFMLLPELKVVVSTVTGLGEILTAFWLLIGGVNVQKWQEQAAQAA